MEDALDTISRGEREHVDYLHRFYFGDGREGLKTQLQHKVEEIDARNISRILIGQPEGGEVVYVRVGRYSPFIEQGERTATLPDEVPPDEITLAKALELLEQAEQSDEPLGTCPATGKLVFVKVGRYGPYVQRGTPDDDEKPHNASLLKGMTVEDIDLATALKLLSLPRELGVNPANSQPVAAFNGRYGPYVKCGDETRSLPADVSPLDVTRDKALELLAQPKKRGRAAAATREPIKVFEASPVTGNPVQLLDGRYGPYVTDGETNASLPKGTSPDEIDLNEALNLLAARKAKGGTTKRPTKRTTKRAPKKATGKKTAARSAAKKRSTKKAATKE
jgi:DNA topoisomerase-1